MKSAIEWQNTPPLALRLSIEVTQHVILTSYKILQEIIKI